MIEKLILLFFDLGLITVYAIIAFIVAMTVQLISYKVFKFNLYKWLEYNLITKYL